VRPFVSAAAGQPVMNPGFQMQPTYSVPVQQNMSPEARKIIDTISELLQDRSVLKRAVVQCFKRVDKGDESIDLNGLMQFRNVLVRVLQVPNEAFGDLQNAVECFDFDDSGLLDVNEVYKLVKFHLRDYRKQLGGDTSIVHVPCKSIQQAGFVVHKELGRGSQGVAKLAVDASGREFCIKCLPKSSMSASGISEMQDEFMALKNLACEEVAQVFELFMDQQFYYMVGEPYYGGDLMTLTERAVAQRVPMTESWWRDIFLQCCEGLDFMHDQAMMHCDIKEPNIMVKTNNFFKPEIVYIDFGVCRAMVVAPNGMPGGTPGYMPPETIDRRRWVPKGDVFCLGVTMIQVFLGKMPPTGPRTTSTPGGIFVEGCQTVQDMFDATKTCQPPFHLLPNMPGLHELLTAMLQKDVAVRPTASNVLGFQWFAVVESPPSKLRARIDRATTGISKSFLERASLSGEEVSPAVRALRRLQRKLGVNFVSSADADESSEEEAESQTESGFRRVGWSSLSTAFAA